MTENERIETQIRHYIDLNILFDDDSITYDDDESFLELGILDSVGVMDLVLFLEQQFTIKVVDREITPENFDTINRIAHFIRSKMSGA
jgi:acyl carrier protein